MESTPVQCFRLFIHLAEARNLNDFAALSAYRSHRMSFRRKNERIVPSRKKAIVVIVIAK